MLQKLFTIPVLLLSMSTMGQQHTIRMQIQSLPSYHPSGSNIYAAGSFNGWNPQDEKFKFRQDAQGHYSLDLQIPNGSYEFKITRGGWDKVECKTGGAGADNRRIKVEKDTTLKIDIPEWQDRFPAKPRVSTASKNVRIIDTAFLIPQLKRVRRVWIYLPPDYLFSKTFYPVLYMHDGQNVFDDATSYAGEWGVDEFMDTIKYNKCIVVAIDNGGNKRLNEYCPYDFSLTGIAAGYSSNKGEGNQYVDFLVKTLKPYIDEQYRTLKDKEHTFIAGSSMGGLISMYAVIKYPNVFGGAGVFSPAFWVGPKIFDDIKAKGKKVHAKIYFYCGGQESEAMVSDMMKAYNGMKAVSDSPVTKSIDQNARHNEAAWRKEFPSFYKWLVGGF